MRPSLRILMVADVSPLEIRGGAERVLWEEAARLADRGHRVRVVSRCPAEVPAGRAQAHGVEIRHFPVERSSSLRLLLDSILQARRAVRQALVEEGADVVRVQQPLSAYGALRAPEIRGCPVLYTFHSAAPLEYGLRLGMTSHHRPGPLGRAAQVCFWALERACLKRADRIHVLSDFSAGQLWTLYGIPTERIVKIPGGVDADRFRPAADRAAVRSALGLPVTGPLLLTVRNLEARMGLDTLLRALAILRRHVPEVLLLIGGAGSHRERLETLRDSLGLQDHVRFLGFIPESDLPRYYQAADLFVLPTRALEGFGLITVEALACGTPVLGTPVGATPEILLPLDPALLMRELTPEGMAHDLGRFLTWSRENAEAALALRQACRRHVECAYTWHRSVDRLEETLAGLSRGGGNEAHSPEPCPTCGGTDWQADVTFLGARYCRCGECGTGVVARRPTADALRHRYEVEYPERFHHEAVDGSRRAVFASILDRLHLPPGGTHLDVGTGGGHLLAGASQRGWRPLGTDLSHRACVIARQAGFAAVQADSGWLPFRDMSADGVSLVNILDHTAAPLATLTEALRVLRPGGELAICIPNAALHRTALRLLAALGPLARRRGWDGYPILHLYAFSPGSVRRLAERAGFEVLMLRNSSLASHGPWDAEPEGRAPALHRLVGGFAKIVKLLERLSGGRCLLGSSIELYARRPHPAGEAGP